MNDCAAPRHHEAVPAEPAAYLCRSCETGLRRDLHALPRLHANLEELLDPRRGNAGTHGYGNGDSLPYHEAAAECMSQIRHDTGVWVKWVIGERQPDAWPVPALPVMCGWLGGHARWASFRPWAGHMAGAFAADRGRAVALLNPRPVSSFPLPGTCPRCGTIRGLSAVIYHDPGDPRPSLVTCGGCGYVWDGTMMLKLGRDILRAQAA